MSYVFYESALVFFLKAFTHNLPQQIFLLVRYSIVLFIHFKLLRFQNIRKSKICKIINCLLQLLNRLFQIFNFCILLIFNHQLLFQSGQLLLLLSKTWQKILIFLLVLFFDSLLLFVELYFGLLVCLYHYLTCFLTL